MAIAALLPKYRAKPMDIYTNYDQEKLKGIVPSPITLIPKSPNTQNPKSPNPQSPN